MNYQYTIYEKKGHIAYVTLNRPEVMNALHDAAHVELQEIFNDFKHDDESWVAIITGAGNRAFSAGNDLKATAAATTMGEKPAGEKLLPFGGITSGFECMKPLIAAVNGWAMGGGFETALACDIIVAAENAVFALPEPRVGLIAGSGVHRLPRMIGQKNALGMILTGRRVSAAEGKELGFVNEVVPAGEALTQARMFLWTQYRNVGGLFYSMSNQYDLYLASQDEVLALR